VHAVLEEEIFYPTIRKQVGEDLMNEADEEHHVAKLLIAELENLKMATTIATRSLQCLRKTYDTTSRKKKTK